MRWGRAAIVGTCVAVGTLVGAGVAAADDPGNSAAAHLCGDGPQKDYYVVSGQEPGTEAPIDFGGLEHGVDSLARVPLAFVVTDSHGECAGFFAQNKKKGGGSKPTVSEITITKVVDVSSAS
jgi:hypothetical protein